ncbi:glycosyltransferase family 1 protein [Francisella salimarina]|uniref:glycosyltransferase family protein n=1 Tax=Francisella salimarina TaxID=2599927 RepID=UPI0037534662
MINKKVLVCASPDLNYIDGSSIWLQTIMLVVSATGYADIDFIAKSTPERDELYAKIKADKNISIIDGTDKSFWNGKGIKRLNHDMMADLAAKLDDSNNYDIVIVRGFEIAKKLADYPITLSKCWLYLTDIPQSIKDYSQELRQDISELGLGCRRVLCQTEGFKDIWLRIERRLESEKVYIYSPVIPDFAEFTPVAERKQIATYAGKYTADWNTLEMARAWVDVYDKLPNSQLIMIGDKIHNDPIPENFATLMRQVLENTKGLEWLGALSREGVYENLLQARVGLSWRDESLNDIVEYSTKLLEYGSAGCAAIVNRNLLHEQLLGRDYPLFANSDKDFQQKLKLALTDDDICQKAANIVQKLARKHTFSDRVETVKSWILNNNKLDSGKKIVLVAGHDLKFFGLLQNKLEATGKYTFIIDKWLGHNKHDENQSQRLLKQADVIFCEWCLGNLKWYSNNKLSYQRLVARFHGQERFLPYLTESNWDNIDHIAYVSDVIRRTDESKFPIEKTSIIVNYIDSEKFKPNKKTGESRYTLGIIGVVPTMKRLDRALDLLEELLEEDSRYCLRVKGKNPLEYDWLLKREAEIEYYKSIFERINSSDKLRYKVIFDPAGDDVNEWLSLVGFILSPSDFESFHMAIGEGMLTGATPVVWNWDGANEIWPDYSIVKSVDEAKELIQKVNQEDMLDSVYEKNRGWMLDNYVSEGIVDKWRVLLNVE